MRVYLDNCMFNRPFDDQVQIRIRLESEAKLYVQDKIKSSGESLFLRKLVLGIPAQASGKNLTRPLMPSAPQTSCVRATSPHHRKLGAGYVTLPQMTGRRVGKPFILSTPTLALRFRQNNGPTPSGDYQPSRSLSLAGSEGVELIWSYILEIENSHNPHDERRVAIQKWKNLSTIKIVENSKILANASQLLEFGIKPKDALHVASAVEGKADCFLTTDDKLLSGIYRSNIIEVLNPVDYIKVIEK